jgi:4,5-DOPA dioxygenase extradiol
MAQRNHADRRDRTVGRRDVLHMGLGAGLATVTAGAIAEGTTPRKRKMQVSGRMPVIFLAHGAPVLLDMDDWVHQLGAWARDMPRPRSILMLSAHWEHRPITLGATRTVPLVYDFYGFPEKFYRQQYPAPGAPELAARVKELLTPGQPVADSDRGLDHGAYVPLVAMYPEADIPVLQVSLPSVDPVELFSLGRTLTPLRDEGVLIVGSGFLTHNLRRIDFSPHPKTPSWAAEFDAWAGDALKRKDVDALIDFQRRGPGADIALPTTEHYVPVLAALGAAVDDPGPVGFPITGFMGGTATKRSVQFG